MTCNFPPLLAILLVLGACDRTGGTSLRRDDSAATGTASATPPQQAVATLEAGAGNMTFALVPGSCIRQSCPAEIALLTGGQQLDVVPLDFAASDAGLKAQPNDASFATNQAFTTYTAGEEEGTVTTLMQLVRLAPERRGLLVHQEAGFDHVKRRRDLFIIEGRKLKKVWSRQDGPGPVSSYADVVRRTADADEIVLIEGFSPVPSEADQITALRLTWDDRATTLQTSPVKRIGAVVVGNFADAPTARLALADPCLANYWIVKADDIGEKSKRFVLARLFTDTAAPSLNAEVDRDCASKHVRRMAQFRLTQPSNR